MTREKSPITPTEVFSDTNPQESIHENNSHPKDEIPHPANHTTLGFLQLAVAHGIGERVKERNLLLTARYLSTNASLRKVAPYGDVTTKEGARRIVRRTLVELWEASPSDLKSRYPLEVVLLDNSSQTLKRNGFLESPTGRVLSEETRAKLSAARKGSTHSVETRAKIGAAHKGKTMSEKSRAKISAYQKAKWENIRAQQEILESDSPVEGTETEPNR